MNDFIIDFSKVSIEFYRNDLVLFRPNHDYLTCNRLTRIYLKRFYKSSYIENSYVSC